MPSIKMEGHFDPHIFCLILVEFPSRFWIKTADGLVLSSLCVFYIYWKGNVNCTEDILYKAWDLKFTKTINIIVFLEGNLIGSL